MRSFAIRCSYSSGRAGVRRRTSRRHGHQGRCEDVWMLTGDKIDAVRLALGRSTLLRGMSEETRNALIETGSVLALTPGQKLFDKGDPGDALFVIVEGEVEIGAATKDGRGVRIAALGTGAIIGEMALLDGGGRSADAVALRRTRLVRIARDQVLRRLKEEPDALLALAAELSHRLRGANAAIETAALLDLGGRLARVLLQEAGGGKTVALPQGELARRIGASREKVNRKLSAWRDEGWISVSRAGIRIEQPRALESLVEELLSA